MRLRVRVDSEAGGFVARCLADIAPCAARGATREAALETLRQEVLYYLEKCPCSTMPDDSLELDAAE